MRFPEFQGEWEEKLLGEVCTYFSGGTPLSSRKDYYDGTIPFIRSGEIAKTSTELFISEDGYNSSSAKMVQVGDLLLALYGVTSGQISISRIDGAINQAILCIKTDVNKIFLESLWRKHIDKILATYLQGGQGNLSAQIVASIKFTIPTNEEQDKIAKLMSLVNSRIDTQIKIIEELERLKKGVENSMLFCGTNSTPSVRFPEFSSPWKQTTLGKLTTNYNVRNKEAVNYPMYSVTNSVGFIKQSEHFENGTIVGEDIASYKVINTNEFAYNPARINVGSIARYKGTFPCMISSLYVCFRVNENMLDPDLMEHLMKTEAIVDKYNKYAEGGVRQYLFYPNFARIPIRLPKLVEQRKLANFLFSINEKIRIESMVLDSMQIGKKHLLQNLFI